MGLNSKFTLSPDGGEGSGSSGCSTTTASVTLSESTCFVNRFQGPTGGFAVPLSSRIGKDLKDMADAHACAAACEVEPECKSFSSRNDQKQCRLGRLAITDTSGLKANPESEYYVEHEDCVATTTTTTALEVRKRRDEICINVMEAQCLAQMKERFGDVCKNGGACKFKRPNCAADAPYYSQPVCDCGPPSDATCYWGR